MSLIDFYKLILASLGLEVKDDYIYIRGSKNELVPLMAEQKQLVLPTRAQLNSLIEEDEDGEFKVTKLPYNPLNEDVVKGDTQSLKKTKLIVERQIGHAIAITGELLLTLATSAAFQKKTNMELNKFLSSITVAKNQNIKHLVDETSIAKWGEMYANSLTKQKGMISIYLKKSGMSNGEKFNRLAVLNSPVYDDLLEADKDTPVYDVKLRNKDLTIFKLLFEFLLPDMNSNHCIEIGSNDNETPAFIALYKTYIRVITRTNRLLKLLSHVDKKSVDAATKPLEITEDDLTSLGMFKQELVLIPNENDLSRSTVRKPVSSVSNMQSLAGINNTNNARDALLSKAIDNQPYPQHAVEYGTNNQPNDERAVIDKILSRSPVTVMPFHNTQPTYASQPQAELDAIRQRYSVQPTYQQPAYGSFGGVYGQPYGQPASYTGPMYQQPYTAPGSVSSLFRYR